MDRARKDLILNMTKYKKRNRREPKYPRNHVISFGFSATCKSYSVTSLLENYSKGMKIHQPKLS